MGKNQVFWSSLRRRGGLGLFTLGVVLTACEEDRAPQGPITRLPASVTHHRADQPVSPLGTPCPPKAVTGQPLPPINELNPAGLSKLKHFVIIYMENHSFDNMYGQFPGADGIVNSNCEATSALQRDARNLPYSVLPNPSVANWPFPALPNRAFPIAPRVPPSVATIDLVHRFYTQQAQINFGGMNKFVAYSDARSLTMGFYDTMLLPVPAIAANYTVCDRFFHSAFGGSFLNHMWLVGARSPEFPGAPPNIVEPGLPIEYDPALPFPINADGSFTGADYEVTPDGFAVNTLYSVNTPHPLDPALVPQRLPAQTYATIGDRLSDAGVSWAWYSGGWDDAIAYSTGAAPAVLDEFQFHHQPFAYFANYGDGTPGRAAHLKDETEFLRAVKQGTLPEVSFVKPVGIDNEHPGYTDVLRGENYLADLIQSIMMGPNWPDTAIIIAYDENGGFADHVPPPVIDRWGPGTRVPAIVISPYARRGFIDHTQYETVSILTTLERRYGLPPLTSRDANANDLSPAFDFDTE
ncbi:MAG TPA: acid phosphatase [Polyangiaceae bacterium]|nr:acid phosphatase [Polyangiaceae bacterium]